MRRALLVLLALAVVAVPVAGANFNSTVTVSGTVTTEPVSDYLKLFSDAADTTPLTGYADKRNSDPVVRAATGADAGLAVSLGGYKNTNTTPIPQVLTLQAANPLPNDITSITVSGTLVADGPSGKQPMTGYSFSPLGGGAGTASVTLTPGQKVWLNLSASMKGSLFPGNNLLYEPHVLLTVRYAGYSGNFLSYFVPLSIWDGNGAGP
jgi:hypothetical protein